MKYKPLIYFIIALTIFIIALLSFVSDSGRRGSVSLQNQFRLDVRDDVVCFELSANGKEKLRFMKTDADTWLLNEIIAVDPLAVTDMLTSLEKLQVRSPVALENRKQVLEQLDESGIKVKIFAKRHLVTLPGNIKLFARKKPVHKVIIGNDLSDGSGTYANTVKSEIPYVVFMPGADGAIGSFFSIEKYAWADPVVVSVEPAEIKKIVVQDFNNPDVSFQLIIEEKGFYFINNAGKKIDNELINKDKLGRFMNSFRRLRYERKLLLNDECKPDDVLSDSPFLQVTIASTSSGISDFQFFRRKKPDDGTLVSKQRNFDPNRFYLKTGECDFAIGQYYIFQPIMRPLTYFIDN